MTVSHRSDLLLVAFDLDDTLAPSKSPLPPPMAQSLLKLLDRVEVCVISGGNYTQFDRQLLSHLPANPVQLAGLHLMPTCGTRYYRFVDGELTTVYENRLSDEQKHRTMTTLRVEAEKLGLWEANTWGEIIEDRGSQITFSALGQEAPIEAKRAWDPTGAKKQELVSVLRPLLPDLEVRGGGSTSVDITEKGIDKAYGMRHLVEQTGISPSEMLFIGDRLDPGGNDYPVLAAGWPVLSVRDWEDTVTEVNRLNEILIPRSCQLDQAGT